MKETEAARRLLESAILRMVKEYGTSYEDEREYYSNEFGIIPQCGERIDKVYDFWGGYGCAFIHNLSLVSEKAWDDLEYTLVLQLYSVVCSDGSEHLEYYAHCNLGTEYEAASCDVLHASISCLELEELCLILKAIEQQEEAVELGNSEY